MGGGNLGGSAKGQPYEHTKRRNRSELTRERARVKVSKTNKRGEEFSKKLAHFHFFPYLILYQMQSI